MTTEEHSNKGSRAASTDFQRSRQAFTARRIAILTDDFVSPQRSCLVAPAQDITPEIVNSIISTSGGLSFVAIGSERARAFLLEPMRRVAPTNRVPAERGDFGSVAESMCTSVEAREGVTTGISAFDRARTIGILGNVEPNPRHLVRPGHIFPIETRSGGVLVKNCLWEGAVDLAKLCGFTDAALVVDFLDSSGDYADRSTIDDYSQQHKIPQIRLSEIVKARLEFESIVVRASEAMIQTRLAGPVRAIVYQSRIDNQEHIAFVKGTIDPSTPTLIRVQPELTFGDVFDARAGSSRTQIDRCLSAFAKRGVGVFVYLRRPFQVQFDNLLSPDTSEYLRRSSPASSHQQIDVRQKPTWMMREYGLGAQILRDLGVEKAEVLTGTSRNLVGIRSFGIEIVAQSPIPLPDSETK